MTDTTDRTERDELDATATAAAGSAASVDAPRRAIEVRTTSQRRLILRRFLRHRLAVASLVILVLIVIVSLLGSRLWRYGYSELLDDFNQPPSSEHPLGIDDVGRDLLAKVLRGAQRSVQIALLVSLLSTTVGTLIGAIAGYYRGIVDAILMRLTDLFLVVPALAIFALLVRILDGSWLQLALILAAFSWMAIARIVRAEFLSLREKEFVEAARALGASDAHIIFRHLLPNAVGSIIVNATITVAVAILAETGLSFIGLGIQAPDTSLGLLVSEGQAAFQTRPYLFYYPGLIIILIALCVNFVGDGLRDAFDPRQKRVK